MRKKTLPASCPLCGAKDVCWLALELKEFSDDCSEIYEIFECAECGAWFKATYPLKSFNILLEKKEINPSDREDGFIVSKKKRN